MASRSEGPSIPRGFRKTEAPMRRSDRINGQFQRPSQLSEIKRKARQAAKKPLMEAVVRDIFQTAQDAKNLVRGPTGLIYDHRMTEHRCLWDPNYQECPERFTCVIDRCKELGLLERCQPISAREATEDEVLRLHSQEHLDRLKATEGCEDAESLEALSAHYDAIYIHPTTYRLSLLSVGSTIELVDQIVKGKVQNGMAIIRPPGHHAMKSEYCGYCYFNNVALAADYALNELGITRILIVDWDVHHGQATQQMFYSDPRVVYFSIHRYEHGTFWPNLRESEFDYIGEGEGCGFNFNIPLNKTQMQDSDYMAVFHQILLPVATEFQPELIIISSGYDAAIGCPEGEMEITPACYAHLLSSLMGLACGKVAVVLEGGYFLKSLAEGAALTLRTLLGDPCPNIDSLTSVSESITATILNAIYSHRDYWKCLQFQEVFSLQDNKNNVKPLDATIYHVPKVVFNFNESKPTIHLTRDCYPRRSEEDIARFDNMLNKLIAETKLTNPLHKVCLVYDPLMMAHRNDYEDHPEKPERISAIYEIHKEFNLLERLHRLETRTASDEELLLVHEAEHITQMKSIEALPDCSHDNEKSWCAATNQRSYHSVYLHRQSFSCAVLAAGSLLQVVDSVMKGESGSGIAIIRPPGHHAEPSEPCGFCIFNNAALAAKYAISKFGLKKILLIDWDVHHGNGTQHIFEDDPRVLYISIHRYDNGNFFPGSTDAAATVVGSGKGRGFNVNIPWNKRGMGAAEYIAAFHHVVLPIAYEYNPELVIISAGFDAAVGDPLGGCKVTPETYAHLTHWLMPLARGRVILSLEGGYNVRTISYAMTMCTKALLGDPLPCLDLGLTPCSSAISSIKEVLQVHSEFWQIRHFNKALPKENILENVKGRNRSLSKEEPPLFHLTNATDDMKLANEQNESSIRGSLINLKNEMVSSEKSPHELEMLLSHDFQEPPDSSTNISVKYNSNINDNELMLSLVNQLTNISIGDGDKIAGHQVKGIVNTVNNEQNQTNRSAPGPADHNSGESSSGSSHSNSEPKKQTLVDYLAENIQLLTSEQMYAVVPLPDCPHLPQVSALPDEGINVNAPCVECLSTRENWSCLTCYSVHCGRFINGHMIEHGENSAHPLCLSFSDLSVWCYGCEAYVDNPVLYSAKNAAHISKFGTEMPWSYRTLKG